MHKKKERKIKFYLFPAKRYLGKCEFTKTLYKITMQTNLLLDEELFIKTLIHELIHIDFNELLEQKILKNGECNFLDFAHDRLWTGDYCSLALDQFHWKPKRKKRKMIL